MPGYLQRRRQRWYFVIAIPARLQPQFGGRRKIIRSLGTSDLRVARPRALAMAAEWKARFGAMEGSLEDARRVAREEYEKARRDVLDGAVDTPVPPVEGVEDADPLDFAVSVEIDHLVDHVARRRGIDVYRGDPLPADIQARIDGLND